MSEATLQLDHSAFTFEIIQGTVKDTNMWTETNVSSGGGGGLSMNGTGASHHKKIRTSHKNKREFWLEDQAGKEYHFIVNADRIPLRKDQNLKLLIAVKGSEAEPVLISNEKQERLYTAMSNWSLAFNEAFLLNTLLLLGAIIGIFFLAGPALISALYTGLILFIAMRWMNRLGYYKLKMKMIKSEYFSGGQS